MMRKLAVLFLLPLIFSCGGTSSENAESGNVLENLTFTVDTVLINSDEKIINLSNGIGSADLDADRRFLYQFDPSKPQVNEINLNELRL